MYQLKSKKLKPVRKLLIRKFTTLLVVSFTVISAHQQQVTTYIGPRSQSINAARELLGFAHRINTKVSFERPIKWSWIVTPQAMRSFWPDRINHCLLDAHCLDNNTTFAVSGSRAHERDPDHWLADYFGLPTDFVSKIHTAPRVKNALIDVQFYAGLDHFKQGLYVSVHAPFVHADWSMKLTETVTQPGTNNHDPGYFNDTGVDRSELLNSFSAFISGGSSPNISNTTFQPLQNAKISLCPVTKNNFAEILTIVGYQLYQTEQYYLDIFGRLGIPAGNKPKGHYLFEPIIGNGHHWEVGIGASGYIRLFEKEQTKKQVVLYAYVNINHLFSTTQCRVFDLKNKPLSRYMLAQKMAPPVEQNLTGNGSTPSAQFKREFAPIANFTALSVDVHTAYQAEFALMFEYTKERFSWLIGYNLWARSAEKIKQCGKTPLDVQPNWALKGDAHVLGFEDNTNTPIALSASQSEATINAGNNFGSRGNLSATQIEAAKRNPNIDNPRPAFADSTNIGPNSVTATQGGNPAIDQINTSLDPIILKSSDIDLKSASTKGLSHTIFAQVQRTWIDRKHFTPYVGLGAQIEFGPCASHEHSSEIPQTINCALGNWGVWFKMGISYQ